MAFDLRTLRYFQQVAELGSISRAARALNVAQPALSQRMSALEADLSVKLLVRSHHGVKLTAEGERLRRGARDVLDHVEQLQRTISVADGTPYGNVRIGMPSPTAVSLVPALIPRVAAAYPAAKLHIEEGNSAILYDGLLAGYHDLIVTACPANSARVTTQLLTEESFYLIGGPDSDLGKDIAAERLGEFPLIRPAVTSDADTVLDSRARSFGRFGISPAAETSSVASTKILLAESGYYSIMVWSAVERDVRLGHLKAAKIVQPEAKRQLYLGRLHDRDYSPLIEAIALEILNIIDVLKIEGKMR